MNSQFRLLPAIDKLIKSEQGQQLIALYGHSAVVTQLRQMLDTVRQYIINHKSLPEYLIDETQIFADIETALQQLQISSIKPIFNLTGTILHTNLGRAVWSKDAINAAINAMGHNVALEFDLNAGSRGHRDLAISELLATLTGAESACIVNNNAAAVLLILATFAQGKEVIISRGELVEIGGAFRIPAIMEQAGCRLVEVGTTNRTHLADYRQAINENTAFIMKVHTSNYQIQGFTATVSEQSLVELAREYHLPIVSDLGSGSLLDMAKLGLPDEPMVQTKIYEGVDLVSFSGDKLLGGVQAGIIVGKKAMIDKLQRHPLKRALRCDKVILAGLEATLRSYLFPEKVAQTLPTYQLLTQSLSVLQHKAEQLRQALNKRLDSTYFLQIEPSFAQIGSGALPTEKIPSIAVTIKAEKQSDLLKLEQWFKHLSIPIIGHLAQQKLWLDLRSVVQFEKLMMMLEAL